MTDNYDDIDGRLELIEARTDRHDQLLYGINYLNVPGVADKLDEIERSIKRRFWILITISLVFFFLSVLFSVLIAWSILGGSL